MLGSLFYLPWDKGKSIPNENIVTLCCCRAPTTLYQAPANKLGNDRPLSVNFVSVWKMNPMPSTEIIKNPYPNEEN